MIALDASVLIAYFDSTDLHHDAAASLLDHYVSDGFCVSPLTQAEVLVRPADTGREDDMLAAMRAIGITTIPLSGESVAALARIRSRTRTKMPDACLLLVAQQTSSVVATLDTALADKARALGLTTVGT